MESVIESVARYAVNANHTYPRQVHTLVLSHRARSCLEFNETEHKENGVRKLIPLLTLEILTNVLGLNQLVEDLELQTVSQSWNVAHLLRNQANSDHYLKLW